MIDPAALKRLASAVRFRPWPPPISFAVSWVYGNHSMSSKSREVPVWSPLGVQTRSGDHGSHRGAAAATLSSFPTLLIWSVVILTAAEPDWNSSVDLQQRYIRIQSGFTHEFADQTGWWLLGGPWARVCRGSPCSPTSPWTGGREACVPQQRAF